MNTYRIGSKALSIQSRQFQPGDIVGTGDVDKGEFTPAKGLETIVAIGHVVPRLADGRIVIGKPEVVEPTGQQSEGDGEPEGEQPEGDPAPPAEPEPAPAEEPATEPAPATPNRRGRNR